jgi:Reverse transcriptase (RNA-dependent DNA polymerase)
MDVVRFADDFVAGFEHEVDAQRFLADLRERFAKFGLELHPDKTRLIEFGRNAARTRKARGVGKPETFDFLGFTHICGKGRSGRSGCGASPSRNGCGPSWPTSKTSSNAVGSYPSPNRAVGWAASCEATTPTTPCLATATLPKPSGRGDTALDQRAPAPQPSPRPHLGTDATPDTSLAPIHPHPARTTRSALRRPHPRQEPSAVVPLAGICAGGRPQGRSLPRSSDGVRVMCVRVPRLSLPEAESRGTGCWSTRSPKHLPRGG